MVSGCALSHGSGQQRVADAPQWDIGQRQAEHHQIGGEIGPLDAHARDVRDAHGERVVAAGGAARAHGKSRADADEQRADHGGEQRHFGQLRPERREQLVELVGQREAHGRDERVGNEAAAQQPPAPAVAQQVQHKAGDSGGEGEPMVEQQRRAEHAALGDAGDGVDVVETERQERAGEKRHAAAPALQAAHGGAALVPEAAQGGGRQAKTSRSVVDLAAQAVVSRTKPSG